jgi:DNA polymerase-3 subunit delta
LPSNAPTYLDFEKEVKSGKISPVYFISAVDNYFLAKAGEILREKLTGSKENKENFFLKYGDETPLEEILDLCRNFSSLFSEKKIVIVKRCEKFGRYFDELAAYSKNPDDYTTLVLAFDKDYVIEKKLDSTVRFYDFTELPEPKYAEWVKAEFNRKGCKIDDKEVELFIQSVPGVFDLVETEIEKISNYFDHSAKGDRRIVTKDIILKFIGYDREYTPDELISSILRKDSRRALEILEYLLNKEAINPVYLLSIISSYYMDLMVAKTEGIDMNNTKELYGKYRLWSDRIRFVKANSSYVKPADFEAIFDKILKIDQKLKTSSLDPGVLFASLVQELSNFH